MILSLIKFKNKKMKFMIKNMVKLNIRNFKPNKTRKYNNK
jgi:hypothetical protein